jgi:hypothetical protein
MRDPSVLLLSEYQPKDVPGFLHGRFVLVQDGNDQLPPNINLTTDSWMMGRNGTALMESIKRDAFKKHRGKILCAKDSILTTLTPRTSTMVTAQSSIEQSMLTWMQRVPYPTSKFYRVLGNDHIVRYPTICALLAAYMAAKSEDPTFAYNIETMSHSEFNDAFNFSFNSKAPKGGGQHHGACIREATLTSSPIRPSLTKTTPSVMYNETLSPPLLFSPGIFSSDGKDFFFVSVDPLDPLQCHRRGFPNFETFLTMNWTIHHVQVIPFRLLEGIPFCCTYTSLE